MKKIFIKMNWISFPHLFLNILNKHYEVINSDNPDFYFYQYQNNSFLNLKRDAVKIFCAFQNTFPDMNFHDYAISVKNFSFKERYFYYMSAFVNYFPEKNPERPLYSPDYAKRKFCNFVYSGHSGRPEADTRENFCLNLSKYKRVDCPGERLNNMPRLLSPKGRKLASLKPEFLKQYKFSISFENSYDYGYITEKIGDAFMAGSVPIYYGAPDVTEIFNPTAFVDCRQFKSLDEAIEYVKYLDENDDEYLKMLNAPIFNDDKYIEKLNAAFEEFLINIIENGKIWANKWSQSYDVPWYLDNLQFDITKEFILKPILADEGISITNFFQAINNADIMQGRPRRDVANQFIKLGDNVVYLLRLKKYINLWNENFLIDADFSSRTLDFLQIISALPEDKISFIPSENKKFSMGKFFQQIFRQDREGEPGLLYKKFFDLILPRGAKLKINPGYIKYPDPGKKENSMIFSIMPASNADFLARDNDLAANGYKIIQYEPEASSLKSSHKNISILNLELSSALNYLSSLSQQKETNNVLCLASSPTSLALLEKILAEQPSLFNKIIINFDNLSENSSLKSYLELYNHLSNLYKISDVGFNSNSNFQCRKDYLLTDAIILTFSKQDELPDQNLSINYYNQDF